MNDFLNCKYNSIQRVSESIEKEQRLNAILMPLEYLLYAIISSLITFFFYHQHLYYVNIIEISRNDFSNVILRHNLQIVAEGAN